MADEYNKNIYENCLKHFSELKKKTKKTKKKPENQKVSCNLKKKC